MSAYPYDWKGTASTNQFTEERILESDIASDRVLILQHRPFFQAGFSVRQASASNPLTPGVDYELAYQLTELDDSVAGPLFVGVNIINPAIKGSLIFKGQHLGGTYYDGLMEIFDQLVKYLNNPTSASWFNVNNRPSLYPVMPAATSWADLLNKKYVASAIHDVELDTGAANDEIKGKLAQLKTTVESLYAEIEAFDYPSHVNAKNPHGTNATQIGAHPISLKAADTFLAYGKSLKTLTAEVRALGLQQADIDKYIETWAFKDIKGTFVQLVQANQPLFTSPSGASNITFTDTGFDLKTTDGIALRAGFDGTATYFEWVAGANTMRIESSGTALGMDKLTVNGIQLLTTTTLMEYQQAGDDGDGEDPDDQTLHVESQSTQLAYTGKGSKVDPVQWNLTLPSANTTDAGAVELVNQKSAVASGQAVTPQAVAAYDNQLSTFVPTATRLNSQPMTGASRTLTKADIGLANADNTADMAKPISADLQTALDGKSAKVHKHAWSTLGVPNATPDDNGIIRIAVNEAGLADGRGTAPNVLYQLQLQLQTIADKLKDADPKAVTDYMVIGASTWTTASSKLALSVQDLKYFYMANGTRKEGKATGSVNLETTPMFNWFQPTNTLEKNWANGVLHNTQLALTSTVTTLPLYARTIGLTASQVGDLSVISVLAKERVVCSTGRLRVMAIAGGNISLYINGELVASGSATVDGTFDVDSSLRTHCVAFRADCNDSTKPAAIAFEIWDTNYPIVASSPTTQLVQLSEFIKPYLNRHFLYLNMLTGSMFGRAEPITSDDLNVNQALIGYVDCGATGVETTTVSFGTMADFGQFEELTAHQDLVPAHVPVTSDWYLSDNPTMKRLAIASGYPACIASGPPSGNVVRDTGILTGVAPANPSGGLSLWMSAEYAGPQQWMTPANPYENNLLTYEGSLALFLPLGEWVGTDVWLTFAQKAKNGVHKYFHINPFSDEAEYGYLPEMATNPAALTPYQAGVGETVPLAVYPYDANTGSTSNPADWGEALTADSETRAIVRYRFVPKTLTLRVEVIMFAGDGLGSTRSATYEMPFDLRDCMGGFVGINRKQQLTAANHTLYAGIFPSADVHKYSYLRSLFESYVRGTDFGNQGQGRGLQQKLLTGGALLNWLKLNATTEFIGVPTSGGKPMLGQSKYVPMSLHISRPPIGQRLGPEIHRLKTWSDANNPTRGGSIRTRFAVVVEVPADFDKITWDTTSNYTFTARLGTKEILNANGNGVNQRVVSTQSSNVGKTGELLFIEFTPPDVPTAFYLDSAVTLFAGSTTVANFTFNDAAVVTVTEDTGPTLYLCKFHPFNMPTAVWDWVIEQMKQEEGLSPTLGVWN
jgi:hypothetical protein